MARFRGWAAGVALVCVAVTGAGAVGCSDGASGKPPTAATRRRIDHYVANYARWSPDSLEIARRHQLVITHDAERTLTREIVASLQAGVDPDDPADDVLVLCYVSIGEDMRPFAYGDVQALMDPRLRGDGSGPRMDPRGPDANGESLDGIDPLGSPSNGGTGFASYYLDDRDVRNSPNHVGDGLPDRNPLFGSLFVNAGDPSWFDVVDKMTLDGPDALAGLAEVLTPNTGRGLDCDGVFLDTIDTAAPNSFTDHNSANQTEYEWTAPGFAAFIRRVRDRYPDKYVLQNRGLFFFDPRHPHFRWNAQGAIDFVLFESYRLDSDPSDEWNAMHYPDNRYQTMPKLMAAANRPDGFQVLSLGYAEGPPDRMSSATLFGQSSLGMQSLREDIDVTQRDAGFRHYLTDGDVTLVNDFVRTHASLDDHEPPHWSSTYNDHGGLPAVAPTPRVGLQQATGGGGRITVRWDVALDQNVVHYVLYAQRTPFDFAADPTLRAARRIPLDARCPDAYLDGVGPDRYPYEAVVGDFPPGETQYLVVRAVDDAGNEEANTVVLTAVP